MWCRDVSSWNISVVSYVTCPLCTERNEICLFKYGNNSSSAKFYFEESNLITGLN